MGYAILPKIDIIFAIKGNQKKKSYDGNEKKLQGG